LPHWAVSIALEHKGEIISGVIYDPCKDEMFLAEKGIGAWMNETRLRVSARHSIADSLYATGIPFSGRIEDLPETINDLKKLMPNCSGVRRYGAAALDLAYVAAGRYEGYWERNLNNWDIAAGVIIAREAGAMVESISTAGDPLIDGNIIAASEVQFNKFAKIIRE
jgi:myo-inositol-1(or 4)-monophosphatase